MQATNLKALDFGPFVAELWGFKRGQLAEVLDGRQWVRCNVLCLDATAGESGAIVRTVEQQGTAARVLYVRQQQCMRKPEPRDEREAFRKRERERVAAIEARQATKKGHAAVVPVIAPGESFPEWRRAVAAVYVARQAE
jgi:hypothetical protein